MTTANSPQSIIDRYQDIERLLSIPEVAVDYRRVRELSEELSSLRPAFEIARHINAAQAEMDDVCSLIQYESDPEIRQLAISEKQELETRVADLERRFLISVHSPDPADQRDAVLEIRAGVGGDEAKLFVSTLFRMYTRYSEARGWNVEVIDVVQGSPGEIKEVVCCVRGKEVYGRLRHEAGGHRVQRVPVTESRGRVHTSLVTVAILPEAKPIDVEILDQDLKVDVFHAKGNGGQHVQKVATAVRITHLPTGLVAVCQDERSLRQNRGKALLVLRSRLFDKQLAAHTSKIDWERKGQIGTGDRSGRRRTYNYPQGRVTDHVSQVTTHDLAAVLDGNIDLLLKDSLVIDTPQ